MLNSCILCCKLGDSDSSRSLINSDDSDDSNHVKNADPSRNSELWTIDQFFKLLLRYLYNLNSTGGQETNWALLEKVINVIDIRNGEICCKDCYNIVETFCELYDQLKTIELQLNHQVQTLEEVMDASGKMKKESDFLEGDDESCDVILNFKRNLLKRCRMKLKTSSPTLKLIDVYKDKSQQKVSSPFHNSPSPSGIVNDSGDEDYAPSPSTDSDANSEDGTDKSTLHLDLHERNPAPMEISDDIGKGEPDQGDSEPGVKVAKSSYNPESGMHKCSYCPKEFNNRCSIFQHFRRFHSPRPIKSIHRCGTCGEQFKSPAEYHRHRRIAHPGGNTFKCSGCGESFKLKRLLKRHQQTACKLEVRNKVKKEEGEESQSQTEAIPEARSRINLSNGNFQCLDCSKEFTSNNAFQMHYDSQHLKQSYLCTICNLSYKSRRSYQRHHDVAHKKIRFPCPKCQKPFTEKDKLRRHQRYCGTGLVKEKKPLQKCPICEKEVSSIQRHMDYVHLGSRDHLCSHCGKGFVLPGDLRKHVRSVHLQLRDHLCDICGKGMKNNSNLRIHRRQIHSVTE